MTKLSRRAALAATIGIPALASGAAFAVSSYHSFSDGRIDVVSGSVANGQTDVC